MDDVAVREFRNHGEAFLYCQGSGSQQLQDGRMCDSWPLYCITGRGRLRETLGGTQESGENAELELKAGRENGDTGCAKAVPSP